MIESTWLSSVGRLFVPIFSSVVAGYLTFLMRKHIYRFKQGRQADIEMFQRFVEEVNPERCASMLQGKECSGDANFRKLCLIFSGALLKKYPEERNVYYHDNCLNRNFLQLLNFSADLIEEHKADNLDIDNTKDVEKKYNNESLETERKYKEKVCVYEKKAASLSAVLLEFVDLAHERLKV